MTMLQRMKVQGILVWNRRLGARVQRLRRGGTSKCRVNYYLMIWIWKLKGWKICLEKNHGDPCSPWQVHSH